MLPKFFTHLTKYSDSMELLFCHRWILLCFKREFTEAVAIRMWEACWSNYLTDYFHLFLCLGIMAVYADDVIAQNLSADEMLLYFSSLGKRTRFKVSIGIIKNTSILFSHVHGWAVDPAEGQRSTT